MKKPMNILVTVTCVFAAFLGGFHIGRSLNRAPVHIYQQPDPTVEDALPAEKTEEVAPTQPQLLNINTATAEEFDALPGIGAVLAQRIVDHRTEAGGFQAVEELLKVSGIGESKLAEFLDQITVEAGG